MMEDTKDRYRPRTLDDAEPPSLINEPIAFRDTGSAAVLRRWPKAMPLRALLGDCLAQTQSLLASLECGVQVPADQRLHYEAQLRQLFLRSQDMVRILQDCMELAELE